MDKRTRAYEKGLPFKEPSILGVVQNSKTKVNAASYIESSEGKIILPQDIVRQLFLSKTVALGLMDTLELVTRDRGGNIKTIIRIYYGFPQGTGFRRDSLALIQRTEYKKGTWDRHVFEVSTSNKISNF